MAWTLYIRYVQIQIISEVQNIVIIYQDLLDDIGNGEVD